MKDRYDLRLGDCLEVVRSLDAMSVDAIVTDPPAGIGFMGKSWDHHKGGRDQWIAWMAEIAAECLRVAKPGAHALVWALPRTSHWTATAWENAGWEVRDRVAHLFGSGFPKSLDVSKAIDRARYDREQVLQVTRWLNATFKAQGVSYRAALEAFGFNDGSGQIGHWTAITDGAQPAVPTLDQIPRLLEVLGNPDVPPEIERLILDLNGLPGQPGDAWFKREKVGTGRSAIANRYEGQRHTVGASQAVEFDITAPATDAARQWEGWGTALKPAMEDWWLLRKPLIGAVAQNVQEWGTGGLNIDGCRVAGGGVGLPIADYAGAAARWPAHLTLSCWCDSERHDPECAMAMLDAQSGETGGSYRAPSARVRNNGIGLGDNTERKGMSSAPDQYGGSGGASRFFYTAKASRSEREAGVAVEAARRTDGREKDIENPRLRTTTRLNDHPTVKPVELMRWLCRLITPPGGLVLDPFMGSGTTGMAALDEGFRFLGVEAETRYYEIAEDRITHRHLVEVETVEPKVEEPQGRLL